MKTRQRIVNHLRKTRSASAREIARALNLSTPNVRHHLVVLASDGRLETVNTAKHDARGRPEKLYSLSEAMLGNNLPALTGALLLEAGSNINWENIARTLVGTESVSQLTAAARLRALVEKLNEMHYQSRWEAGAEGPRVLFERCPYAEIIEGHPGLCRMDALLLSSFLGMEARQLGKIEGRQGLCVFVVR